MSYVNTWNETTPTSATLANTIAPFFTNNMIAIRERLDDVFGTSALTSIATKDPYAIASIRMTAIADSNVIGGAASWSVRDHTNTYNNLQVMDNGDIILRSGYIYSPASSIIFRNSLNTLSNVVIANDGSVAIANGLVVAAGESDFLGNVIVTFAQASVTEYSNGSGGGALTINWNAGNNQSFTLTGNATITFTNPLSAGFYFLRIIQGGSGHYTITWPATKWAGAAAPTLTLTAGKQDFISFYYDGSSYNGFISGYNY